MNNKILKWRMINGERTIPWTAQNKILHVDRQFVEDEWPTIWVEHSFDAEEEEVTLAVYGTGSRVDEDAVHIGSAVFMSGGIVWHVYLKSSDPARLRRQLAGDSVLQENE